MSGILGTHDLTGGVIQSLYQGDTDQFTTTNISICNRHNVDITITVAITDTANTIDDSSMYIEYETILKPKGVLERSAVVVATEKFITVKSSHNNVSAVVYGVRAGDSISVDSIADATDAVAPVWVTTELDIGFRLASETYLTATDPGFVTYAVSSGTLPPGILLSSNGRLYGNASEAGTYTVTFSATDESGNSSTQAVTLTVGQIATSQLTLWVDTTDTDSWTSGSNPVDLVSGTKTATLNSVSNTHATRDGVTCLEFNDTGSMTFSHSFSVPRTYEIWVYHDQANPASINWETYFDDNSTESILFGKVASTTDVSVYTSSQSGGSGAVAGQTWQQFVYTVDNSSSPYEGKVYKNGSQIATYNNLTRSLVSGASTLYIGGDSGGGECMDGGVAIVRCYNRALTADEIAQNWGVDKSKFSL